MMKGGARTLFTLYLILQLLAMVLTVVQAGPKIPNRPIDGYVYSGYFWPKTIIWHAIRTAPGRYWVAYATFACAILEGFLLKGMALLCYLSPDLITKEHGRNWQRLLLAEHCTTLAVGLAYIAIVSNNLNDVLQTYFVAMCTLQLMIDTLRYTVSFDFQETSESHLALSAFQATSIFPVALQDSYLPLNKMNAAYFFAAIAISMATSAATNEKYLPKKGRVVLGMLASLTQLAFCTAAFVLARDVHGFDQSVMESFFYTTCAHTALCFTFDVSVALFGFKAPKLSPKPSSNDINSPA